MMKNSPARIPAAAVVLAAVLLSSLSAFCNAGALQVGFYKGKCKTGKDVEAIIRGVVRTRFLKDPTIVAALLRLQFHDCFVNGCDASLLLDWKYAEKTAPPNLSVRGYDIIDQAKAAVESACPGVVSCADIIIAATRDAIVMAGGSRYEVQTGRRDGTFSLASNVDLPGPDISVAQSIAAFQKKGLDVNEMVLLLGGHTVGTAHCFLFSDRLYNFNGTGKPDPTMDTFLIANLRETCPQNAMSNNVVNLDQNVSSSNVVDNSYYKQILAKRGILKIDQSLALDSATKSTVTSLASSGINSFSSQFNNAMIKMGNIQVLTGRKGEIRTSCRAINRR